MGEGKCVCFVDFVFCSAASHVLVFMLTSLDFCFTGVAHFPLLWMVAAVDGYFISLPMLDKHFPKLKHVAN